MPTHDALMLTSATETNRLQTLLVPASRPLVGSLSIRLALFLQTNRAPLHVHLLWLLLRRHHFLLSPPLRTHLVIANFLLFLYLMW